MDAEVVLSILLLVLSLALVVVVSNGMDDSVDGDNWLDGVLGEVVVILLLVLGLAVVSVVGWVVSVRVHSMSVADDEVVVLLLSVILLTLVVVVAVWGTNDGVWVNGNGVVVP